MKTALYTYEKVKLYLTIENGTLSRCSFLEPAEGYNADSQNDCESDSLFCQITDQLNEYFRRERTAFTIPISLQGTEFQEAVWAEISKVEYGKTLSYLKLADRVGNFKAVRAVAQACGANPVCIFIPCHRIINSSGKLGGYIGGRMNKEMLLELENSYNNLFNIHLY